MASDTQAFHEVSFESVAAYSSYKFILGRMLPNRDLLHIIAEANKAHRSLDSYPIDPSDEEWKIYVPDATSDVKYGVLVWVASDNDVDKIPDEWFQELNSKNIILVAAENAGENSEFYSRIVPLALNGLNGVVQNYPVDSNRIWIGGDGKAANSALAMALAFPDIFKGFIGLDSTPRIGENNLYVPDEASVKVARNNRYVFSVSQDKKEQIKENFLYLCMPNISILNGEEFSFPNAIIKLDAPGVRPAIQCGEDLQIRIKNDLAKIKSYIDKKDVESALNAWSNTYVRYGGLVEEEIENLANTMLTTFGESELAYMDNYMYDMYQNRHFYGKPKESNLLKTQARKNYRIPLN